MDTLTVEVDVDLSDLQKYGESVERQLLGQQSGPVASAIKKWAVRYRSFIQERYDSFSKGAGNWPDLKESTKRRRRLGKGRKFSRVRGKTGKGKARAVARNAKLIATGKFTILRDLNILFTALAPVFAGAPGALQQLIPFGIRVGFGGSHGYPNAGRATIADIASFHQKGSGHLPKRQIIVDPTTSVTSLMASDMDLGLRKLGDEIK